MRVQTWTCDELPRSSYRRRDSGEPGTRDHAPFVDDADGLSRLRVRDFPPRVDEHPIEPVPFEESRRGRVVPFSRRRSCARHPRSSVLIFPPSRDAESWFRGAFCLEIPAPLRRVIGPCGTVRHEWPRARAP